MEPAKTVEMFGKQEKVGDWVVVDALMTQVLGVGSTPEQALQKAGVDSLHQQAIESRPLLLQVSDPRLHGCGALCDGALRFYPSIP